MPFTKLQASLEKQLIKATKIINIQTIMLSYLIERRESQACARYPEQGQLKNTNQTHQQHHQEATQNSRSQTPSNAAEHPMDIKSQTQKTQSHANGGCTPLACSLLRTLSKNFMR
jgi:hypothetical protein